MQLLHGSGKTAVLVERIINKIVNEKIDIDKLLVVTFTNAAASEMRARIMDAIYKYLEEKPEDEHMQKQTILMGKSNICTIHSFCLDVIKNNFYEISISPNFRIVDQTEIELLKQEVLEDMFEEKYIEENKEFLDLINTYTNYRGDEPLKEIILKIHRFIQASPFPEEWLEKKIEEFNLKQNLETDFSNTAWGEILINVFEDDLYSCIIELKSIKKDLDKFIELEKFSKTISSDIEKLEELKSNTDSWDKLYELSNSLKWDTWPRDSKIVIEQKEIAKEKRDNIKKKFSKIRDKILICDSRRANEDISSMYNIMYAIKNIIIEFIQKYQEAKKEKNIVDFSDIEHFALKILLEKKEDKYIPTKTAEKYMEKFEEIAIDEYQDSNLVQEYILNAVSRGNNIFMVGDVKQSIYKFRQARPELFINKYETYKLKEQKNESDSLKIQLFKNFRSRKNVLDITNFVFENIMSKQLGDINYDEKEYLNLGANFEEPQEECNFAGKTELAIIDLKEAEDEQKEENENIEDIVIEAKLVADKIQELINSKYKVYDKKIGYRDISYKDIVILLRATSNLAPIYERELNNLNIPVFSDVGTQYLETVEIQTIMSVLKIIDNPMQDIPLVSVLRSPIGKFDDNDLIQIKLQGSHKKYDYFYEILLEASKNEKLPINKKIRDFLEQLEKWRKQREYLALDELIWQIYLDTGYYNYVSLMPNGVLRQANLNILFEKAKEYEKSTFKSLFNFINFIDKLKTNNGDMDSAKLIGENEDVVRIMSIHKSKGLEFPVVFLCSTAKKFNMQDLNDNILLHQDIGIGPKYIDYERRIEYNTLAKIAIAEKIKTETISEEMRILYVALTRAKEKLIITGLSKDIEKEQKKKKDLLETYNEKNINPNILKNYKSYLDWIELVYLNNINEMKDIIDLKIYTKDELLQKWNKEENESIEETDEIKGLEEISENKKLKEILDWKYKNIEASTIQAKTSVSKIKEIENKNLEFIFEDKIEYNVQNMKKPKFLQNSVNITNAQIGTLMHLCIQKLDEKQDYTYEKIENLIEKMIQNEIITKQEAEKININKLLSYTKSDLYKNLKKAKEIHKEQPFYMNIPANEIYDVNIEEKILVQGVVDLYYIDENDNIILVDYKTDYVKKDEKELIEKYQKQLSIYKQAIEEALQKEVYKTYIYSIYLDKSIEL